MRPFLPALAVLVVSVSVAGCGSGLPRRLHAQVRRDWSCDDVSGRRTFVGDTSETWELEVCGQQRIAYCPIGPHSRWRRCRYEGVDDVVTAEARRADRIVMRERLIEERRAAQPPAQAAQPPAQVVIVTPAATPPPQDAPAPETEAELRAFLDAQRAVILACAARDVIAVEARWDGSGALAFSLRGLEGTAEERCAVAALASAVAASGGPPSPGPAAGVLVHAVR